MKKTKVTTNNQPGREEPPEMENVPRLSVRLDADEQTSFRRIAFMNGIMKPASAFRWLLERASKPHIYVPLSDALETKLDAAAAAQGIDTGTFALNLILRSLLPDGAASINQVLATGEPLKTSFQVKTNWAGEGKDKNGLQPPE